MLDRADSHSERRLGLLENTIITIQSIKQGDTISYNRSNHGTARPRK